jgi:hypothetical protein
VTAPAVPTPAVPADVVVAPLPYHYAVAELLERENPSSFASLLPVSANSATSAISPSSSGDFDQFDQALLRQAYRLEPAGHPEVHLAARRAATALGIEVPVEIYAGQGGGSPNAELIFIPGRAVLLLSGDVAGLLDADELCAVAGHELAHYLLWTCEGGRLLAASRLLDAAESDARTPSEYLETARRFRLATEVFADRGSLVAASPAEADPGETSALSAAVGGLLKITTGLGKVDAGAYLKQAAEVDFRVASAGVTHPETVLRAWAMQQWLEQGAAAEATIASALAPRLDLDSLDILGQDSLAALTRQMVAELLSDRRLRSDEVLELARQFGVVVSADAVPADVVPTDQMVAADVVPAEVVVSDGGRTELAVETRKYLAAVLLDLATVDPDAGTEAVSTILVFARRWGVGKEFERMIKTELDLSDRTATKVIARANELRDEPESAEPESTR